MKAKLLFSSLFVTLLLSLASCDKKEDNVQPSSPTKIIRASSSRIGDGDVMLSEVTVYGISMKGNNFDVILSWYNSTTHNEERQTVTFNQFDGISMDEAIINTKEFKEKVIAYMKQKLIELGDEEHFNPAELALLQQLNSRQIIRFFFIYTDAVTYGKLLRNPFGVFASELPDGGFSNAFVHIRLAFKLKEAFGYSMAKSLTDAHESTQGNDVLSQMDLLNNSIGLGLDYWTEELMFNLAYAGNLWTLKPIQGTTNYTLGRYKLPLPPNKRQNEN